MRRNPALNPHIEKVRAALDDALLEVSTSSWDDDDVAALLAALAERGFEIRPIEQINGISPA